MSKPILVFQAPVGTRSGYGERSRDLVRALIALDKYDIKIINTRWGNTPMNALTDADEDIYSRFLTPYLNNFDGWVLFADGDMICQSDIKELWDLRDESKALMVVKHDYQTKANISNDINKI